MPYPYYNTNYQQNGYPQYVQPVQQIPQYQSAPQSSVQPTQAAPQIITSGMMWVNDEREASLYPVAPNTAIALWDIKNPVVYVKQSDASGRPSLKIYDLTERADELQTASKPETAKTFATKDELSAVVGAVKEVNGTLASLRIDIDTLKGDMYGIAGKKKPVKKTAEDEENE